MDRTKNYLIAGLLIAVIAMSVGYALLAETLTINGTGKIDAEWDIHFKDDITGNFTNASNATDDEENEILPTSSGITATFSTLLEKPGSKATYTVTVENAGSIDAQLDSITDLSTSNNEEPSGIQFAVTGMTKGDTLASGQSKVITVTVEWLSSAEEIPSGAKEKTVAIALNFIQA